MVNRLVIILIILIVFIVIYNKQQNTEKFENNEGDAEMIFFLSDNCNHCVRYKKHDALFKNKLKTHMKNITFKIAEPEEFSTYGVQSVPKALIRNRKNTHYKLIDGLGGIDESNIHDKVRQVCDAWNEIQKNSLK